MPAKLFQSLQVTFEGITGPRYGYNIIAIDDFSLIDVPCPPCKYQSTVLDFIASYKDLLFAIVGVNSPKKDGC